MKNIHTARPRALALLMAATALPAIPAFAQDAAPPPVAPTAAAPAPAPAPAPVATPAPTFAPPSAVVQPTPPVPTVAPDEAAEPVVRARTAAPRARAPQPAAVRVAPAPVATAAPAQPSAIAPEPAPVETPPPATSAAPAEAPPVNADTPAVPADAPRDTGVWLWIAAAIAAAVIVIGLIAAAGRRRRRAAYDTPTYAEPRHEAVATPVAPVAPVTAPIAAALVEPAERPWLRMTLQPTAIEPIGDGATLFYDLIVENESSVPARDVRVASFLVGTAQSSANERSLIIPAGATRPVSGSVPVADGETKIVADIRYPLPDGSEGHVAARFSIDTTGDTMAASVDEVLERV